MSRVDVQPPSLGERALRLGRVVWVAVDGAPIAVEPELVADFEAAGWRIVSPPALAALRLPGAKAGESGVAVA